MALIVCHGQVTGIILGLAVLHIFTCINAASQPLHAFARDSLKLSSIEMKASLKQGWLERQLLSAPERAASTRAETQPHGGSATVFHETPSPDQSAGGGERSRSMQIWTIVGIIGGIILFAVILLKSFAVYMKSCCGIKETNSKRMHDHVKARMLDFQIDRPTQGTEVRCTFGFNYDSTSPASHSVPNAVPRNSLVGILLVGLTPKAESFKTLSKPLRAPFCLKEVQPPSLEESLSEEGMTHVSSDAVPSDSKSASPKAPGSAFGSGGNSMISVDENHAASSCNVLSVSVSDASICVDAITVSEANPKILYAMRDGAESLGVPPDDAVVKICMQQSCRRRSSVMPSPNSPQRRICVDIHRHC